MLLMREVMEEKIPSQTFEQSSYHKIYCDMTRPKKIIPTTDFFVNLDELWVSRRRIMWRIYHRLFENDFENWTKADQARDILRRYRLDGRDYFNTIRLMIKGVSDHINAKSFKIDGYETDAEIFDKIIDFNREKHARMPNHENGEDGNGSDWEKDDMDVDVPDDPDNPDDPDGNDDENDESDGDNSGNDENEVKKVTETISNFDQSNFELLAMNVLSIKTCTSNTGVKDEIITIKKIAKDELLFYCTGEIVNKREKNKIS